MFGQKKYVIWYMSVEFVVVQLYAFPLPLISEQLSFYSPFFVCPDETCTEPRSEYKPGLLLETILDESPGSAIPSPAEEKHSTDPSAQAVLSWTDINFTPKLLKTSSFQESPPERDPLSTSLGTGLGFTDVKRTPDVAGDEEFKEPVSFNLSNIEPTPKSVKKSLFEDSPQPQEMLPSKQHAPLSHPFTRQTPESVRLPLVIESSPQLDFWLLPQNKNGNHPGSQATPNAIRTELFDGSPLENGNPSFDDLRFLSISGEQFTSQADKASATQPTPMRSPLSRHTTPKITAFSSDHKLDTTELAERLNRIKQAPLERDSWGLQHNTSLKPSTTKHTPKSADKAVNLQTQNVYATHQKLSIPLVHILLLHLASLLNKLCNIAFIQSSVKQSLLLLVHILLLSQAQFSKKMSHRLHMKLTLLHSSKDSIKLNKRNSRFLHHIS